MATNYPGSLDTSTQQPSPLSSTEMDDAGFEHDVVHTNHSGAIIALETKVGTGSSSAVADSVLAGTGSGTSGWTTTPTVTGLEVNDGKFTLKNDSSGYTAYDTSEAIALTSAGMNTTNKYTPGVLFGSTDDAFTTTNPKYNAGIFGRAREAYGNDSDSGMWVEVVVSANNLGTGHGVSTTDRGFQLRNSDFRPLTDDNVDLGTASNRWDDVYATNGTIQTSDQRDKANIADLDLGLAFVDSLRPVSYTWDDRSGYSGTREHMGFVAQEVATALGSQSSTRSVWILASADSDDPGSVERQGLRYSEFIAPMVKAIQELSTRVAALEAA